MKITDVQVHLLAVPMKEVFPPSPPIAGVFHQILVEIKTDEGITGYGESFALRGTPHATIAVIDQVLKPLILGEDPSNISGLMERMYRQTHLFGRYGITTFAISGVDIALWDIAGKCAGLPLHRLLGGTKATEVPAYASLIRYNDREKLKAAALDAKGAGYAMLKLHQVDVESLRTVREAVGEEMKITMDINCAWSPEKALDMARQFAPYHLFWLEEPIWPPEDFQSLARLGRICGIPIASGENACTAYQFKAMLDAGAATYIQPSAIKVGGVSEWHKVAVLAEAFNVKVAAHSPYFGPGLLATAHLIAASPSADWLEYYYVALEASVMKDLPQVKEGFFALPQGPGLGLEIDPAVLQKYRVPS